MTRQNLNKLSIVLKGILIDIFSNNFDLFFLKICDCSSGPGRPAKCPLPDIELIIKTESNKKQFYLKLNNKVVHI